MSIANRVRHKLVRWLTKGNGANTLFQALVPAWMQSRPAAWADDPTEQVKNYRRWVYAAVSTIANAVAMTRLTLYRKTKGGNSDEVTDHPLLDLFEFVNPFHTRFWLWAQTMTFLELTGNAYWYLPKNGLGIPGEIWIAHSQNMKVIPSRSEFIKGYQYESGTNKIDFEPSEIVHLKYPNPTNIYYGRGTLQAAAEGVDTDNERARAHYLSMKRGIFAGAALSTEKDLTDIQINRLETQVQQKHATPERAGRPFILEGGLKASRVDFAPNEMAFLEAANIGRDGTLSIFKVPAAIVGLTDNVNRAVAEAMHYIFARYCIAPKLRMIEDQLNQDLLPRYDERLYCKFEDVIPENREQDRADMESRLSNQVTTINEEREALNRPPVPWGDKPLVPFSIGPLSSTDEEDDTNDQNDTDTGDTEDGEESSSTGSEGKAGPRPPATSGPARAKVKALSPEQRDKVRAWFKTVYISEQAQYERRMARVFERVFKAQERRVIAKLKQEVGTKAWTKDAADDLLQLIWDEELEAQAMANAASPAIKATLKAGADRTFQSVGMNISFTLDNPHARTWLAKKGTAYWKSDKAPNATTIKKIHKKLRETMAEGGTPNDMVAAVRGVFSEASKSRARAIARTETVGAYNGGTKVARDELASAGIQTIKRWFTTLDDNTREWHAEMDNVTVDHNEPFIVNGESMDQPGDPGASAENIVNCRCGCGTEVKEG